MEDTWLAYSGLACWVVHSKSKCEQRRNAGKLDLSVTMIVRFNI